MTTAQEIALPADWPPHLPNPCERDWVEDASHENGCYTCHCVSCKRAFIGHKRRATCKLCVTEGELESERREKLVREAGLDPEFWALILRTEWGKTLGVVGQLAAQLADERNVRRDLVAAYERLAGAVGDHPGAHYPVIDARDILLAARNLDYRTLGYPPAS